MKKILPNLKFLVTIVILFIVNVIYAQDYTNVDAIVKNYPESFSSIEKLAEAINKDFSKDDEKTRAIFTWIALNIKYDLTAYNTIKNGSGGVAYSYKNEQEKLAKELQFRQDFAKRALKTKKGVCQHYSALFHALCDLTGIKCLDIPGTSKTSLTHIGKLPVSSDHIWNAVKIGDSWKFIDVTWASGSVDGKTGRFVPRFNDGYFFTSPDIFFLNHFPDDRRMLMIEKTEQDFAQLPLYYGEYVRSGYEFTSPETGVLTKEGDIPFQITDLPETAVITYAFSNENLLKPVAVSRKGNRSEFKIPMDSKARGYLTIFINNKSIVAYKIAH